MKKNPAVTDATRNKFIRAFCTLYAQKTISKITIKEITDLAGYNRTTFYQYFTDVYALLEYMEDEIVAVGLQKIQSIQVDDPDFNRQFVIGLSEVLQEYDYFASFILQNDVHFDIFQKIKKTAMPFIMERFQISKVDTKAVLILEFYMTGMWTVLTHWFAKPDDLSIEELSELICGIWNEGLLTQLKTASKQHYTKKRFFTSRKAL
ncbi:MAG: TetR/AcrR family transcriptional regulator [Ruminococcus sp.]|nr:TetR/AcrR family transcriptional regulator [Ruminococcus sp.]